MSRNNTAAHLELLICKKNSSQVYKNKFFFNQKPSLPASGCSENTCAEGSAGRDFFFISGRVL